MGKQWKVLVLILQIAIICITCAVFRTENIEVIACQDLSKSDNTVFYLDNESKFYHIDEKGKILAKRQLPTTQGADVISYNNISCSTNGYVYLIAHAVSPEEELAGSWVEQRDEKGALIQKFAAFSVENMTGAATEKQPFTIQTVGDKLAVFSFGSSEPKLVLDLYTDDLEIATTREYIFEDVAQLDTIDWLKYTENGSVYYTDTQNNLWCLDNRTYHTVNTQIRESEYGFEPGLAGAVSSHHTDLYFVDAYTYKLMKYDEKRDRMTVEYAKEDMVAENIAFSDISSARVKGDRLLAYLNKTTFGDTGIFIKDGDQAYVIQRQHHGWLLTAICFVIIAVLVRLAFLALAYLWRLMHNSHSILTKQIAATALIFICGGIVLHSVVRYYFIRHMEYEAFEEIYMLSQSIADRIDGNMLEDIPLPMNEDDVYFNIINNNIRFDMQGYHDIFGEKIKKNFYYNVYVVRNGNEYQVLENDDGQTYPSYGKDRHILDANNFVKETYGTKDGIASFEIAESEFASSLYCNYAVKDDTGKTTGTVEVGFAYDYFYQSIEQIMQHFRLSLIGIMAVLIGVLAMQSKRNLNGLGKLKQGVSEISNANWNTVVDVNSNDELEDIANGFNRMSREVGKYMSSIEKMNIAYEKFVPKETIQLLQKQSVSEIVVGENINQYMTVLTVNVCNFYRLNEEMTSAETFAFMNWLYRNMTGEIVQSGGIIENYNEGGLRALYKKEVEHSIDTALKIIEKIKNDRADIDLDIIIQSGDIMYGVAGTDQKAETVAVSEILNYTYLLKDVIQENDIPLVITSFVYDNIKDKTKYHLRYIGKIKNSKIENVYIDLYDVLDAYPAGERAKRIRTKDVFQKGVLLFRTGDLKEARKQFVDVLRVDQEDKLSQNYLFLCDKLLLHYPESWEGYFGKI